MIRALFCLPLCLALTPEPRPSAALAWPEAASFAEVADDGKDLPENAQMEKLAKTDPIAFLENCLKRYDREVKGYQVTLRKQERIGGKLQRSEVIEAQFREEPFSVAFEWKEGARLAKKVMYVKGENKDQLLVKPSGLGSLIGIVERDPTGDEAKQSGRYPLTEFGIKLGTQRTLAAWVAAKKQDALHVEFLGEKKIKELDDRPCWVLKRTRYKKPEDDGVSELTTYIDKETWLQVGSLLKGADNEVIGEYFFRDVRLNPEFKKDTFTREALSR
jgi:hypothetical protein